VVFVRNFTVEFIDYHGSRLAGMNSDFGLQVAPLVLHRAEEMGTKYYHVMEQELTGGQAAFSSFTIKNLAGRDLLLSFKEPSSKLRVYTHRFSIYPFALELSQPVTSSVAGNPMALALEMHDSHSSVCQRVSLIDSLRRHILCVVI
jgi:hypothetical protein